MIVVLHLMEKNQRAKIKILSGLPKTVSLERENDWL